MLLPVLAYGNRVLKERCKDIDAGYPDLGKLIGDMWETMRNANGCGLAAPQIGQPIRLFIIDSQSTWENMNDEDKQIYFEKDDEGIRETFINARILERSQRLWEDEEGCLSIPGLSRCVRRSWTITIEYSNRDFERQTKLFSGATARMIQHEYDHTDGILYLDHLRPLTRKLMESKLKRIINGQIDANYPMKFV